MLQCSHGGGEGGDAFEPGLAACVLTVMNEQCI